MYAMWSTPAVKSSWSTKSIRIHALFILQTSRANKQFGCFNVIIIVFHLSYIQSNCIIRRGIAIECIVYLLAFEAILSDDGVLKGYHV